MFKDWLLDYILIMKGTFYATAAAAHRFSTAKTYCYTARRSTPPLPQSNLAAGSLPARNSQVGSSQAQSLYFQRRCLGV